MSEYLTANQILSGISGYNWETNETLYIDDSIRETAFAALKEFVASTARGDRRRRILDSGFYNVPHWGILNRLWYYPDTKKVEYCCGQEWNSEMAVLRDAFDWKKGR